MGHGRTHLARRPLDHLNLLVRTFLAHLARDAVVNVCGIDYSTRAVDVVFVHLDDAHSPMWFRYPLTGNDAFDRTRSVANAMPGRSSQFWDDILAVGIEHPGGHHGTRDMLRVQGAILSCIPARMLVEPWPPAKWRKAVGLPGNASKSEIAERVIDDAREARPRWPTMAWPQDACDAYCIALATRQAIQTQAVA